MTAYPPVALSDLDAVDQRCVLGLSRLELHPDMRIILPSGIVVSPDDIQIIVCSHASYQVGGPDDAFVCNRCGLVDL